MKIRNVFITLFGQTGQFHVLADERQQADLRGLLSLIRDGVDEGDEWKGDRVPRLVELRSVNGSELWLSVRAIQSVCFGPFVEELKPVQA